jgi:hypothetical protein
MGRARGNVLVGQTVGVAAKADSPDVLVTMVLGWLRSTSARGVAFCLVSASVCTANGRSEERDNKGISLLSLYTERVVREGEWVRRARQDRGAERG